MIWKPVYTSKLPKRVVSEIGKTFQLGKIASEVLFRRGLQEPKEIARFLHGNYKHMYDPFLFPDMLKAVNRLFIARSKSEKILIHGDYDCDGIIATALIKMTCDDIGVKKVEPYVPNRSLGYGLSVGTVEKAIKKRVKLLITCDCGSNETKPLRMAKEAGIDVIVLDHHSFKRRPRVFAFLNPNEPYYPFSELCGAGVAFKFMQAVARFEKAFYPENYLELVAVATVADAVEILDENRIIVREGLKKLNATSNPGMRALLKVSSLLGRKMTTEIVGFIVAPKINAPGRIADPTLSLRLLLEPDSGHAEEHARTLANLNKQRQAINTRIRNEAIEMIEKNYKDDRVLVLAKDSWEKGVIGIVASTLVEIYHKPAIVISGGYGSVRTVPEFPLLEPLEACSEHFRRWGGHPMAAGVTVKKGRIDALRVCINREAEKRGLPMRPHPRLCYDSRLKLREVNMDLVRDLERLEPFGQGNPTPYFVVEDVHVARNRITRDGQHLQLSIRQGKSLTSSVGFWMAHYGEMIFDEAQKLDVLFFLERSRLNTEQIMVKDLKEVKLDW